jgi:hypothetical protein
MPNVNGKKFPYTTKGKADAAAASKKVQQMRDSNASPGAINDRLKKDFMGDVAYSNKAPRRGDTAESKRMGKMDKKGARRKALKSYMDKKMNKGGY